MDEQRLQEIEARVAAALAEWPAPWAHDRQDGVLRSAGGGVVWAYDYDGLEDRDAPLLALFQSLPSDIPDLLAEVRRLENQKYVNERHVAASIRNICIEEARRLGALDVVEALSNLQVSIRER